MTLHQFLVVLSLTGIFGGGVVIGAWLMAWWLMRPDPAEDGGGGTDVPTIVRSTALAAAVLSPREDRAASGAGRLVADGVSPDVASRPAGAPPARLEQLARPDGWELPAEEIERLEARLDVLYAAAGQHWRREADELAAELLRSERTVQEYIARGDLAVPDWLPAWPPHPEPGPGMLPGWPSPTLELAQ